MKTQRRNKKESINLRNEFNIEDNNQTCIQYQISSKVIELSYFQLIKYSLKFQEECQINNFRSYITEKMQYIQKNGQVNDDNLLLFFKLINEENVEINSEEYSDLCKLSEYFKVPSLQRYLLKYAQSHSNDINFAILQIIENQENENCDFYSSENSEALEINLSKKINECLQNKNFNKLPISIVYRILSKKSKESYDDNLLYNFIMKKIEERYLLFPFLKLQNLSDLNFNGLYENYSDAIDTESEYLYDCFSNSLMFIKQLKDDQDEFQDRIQELEKNQKKLKKKIVNLEEENDKLKLKIKELNEEKEYNKNDQINNTLKELKFKNSKEKNYKNQENKFLMKEKFSKNKKIINDDESSDNEIIKVESSKNKKIINVDDSSDNEIIKVEELYEDYFIDGIFNFLNENENILDQVDVTTSGKFDGDIKNILCYKSNDCENSVFTVKDFSEQWICFEFIENKVILAGYSISKIIRSLNNPKSWIVEGSNDKSEWIKIDEQVNSLKMKSWCDVKNRNVYFECKNKALGPFKFIKITQTDLNWSNSTFFAFHYIEFSGIIV